MDNYKILIVDDEYEVRQGIIDCVDWEKFGFCIVGDAANGIDALEISEELLPDLVIADIKMPYMDGIEMAKQMKLIIPTTKVIFITGFDDFTYAKQAINLNVIEYIIKPINLEELTKVLIRIKDKLDKEKSERENIEFLKEHYYKSIPVLKENFILSLLDGRFFNGDLKEQAKIYCIDLYKPFYIVTCIKTNKSGFNEDNQILNFSIKNIVEEILKNNMINYITMYIDYIVVISCFDKISEYKNVMSLMSELNQFLKKHFKFIVPIGIGYVVNKPEMIYKSFKGAIAALDYKTILDIEKPIFIDDIEPNINAQIRFDEKYELMLLGAIRKSDEEQIANVINILLDNCKEINLPYQKYKIFILEILNSISSLYNSFDITNEEIFGESYYPIEKISTFESKKELSEWLVLVSVKVSNYINRERQKSSLKIIDEAKNYANLNYSNDMFSVEEMCNLLFVSPSYFSSIFKKETGITFINYLTNIRMNEAKKLLIETDLKTYLVAEKVGYIDANYFSFAFKKYFGISPTKFRSANLG